MSFVEMTKLQQKLESVEFDSPTFERVLEEYRGVVNEYQPDVIGLTCMSGDYLIAQHLAKKTKEMAPDCCIVMGGSHASALPSESLSGSIDFILAGQAEKTFVEFDSWKTA